MAAPHVTVTFNFARSELLREGWGVARIASAIKFAALQGVYKPSGTPQGIHLYGDARIIRLTPTIYEEDVEDVYTEADLDMGDVTQFLELPAPDPGVLMYATKRATAGASVTSLAGLVDAAITILAEAANDELVWAWRTKNALQPNEGIAVNLYGVGSARDKRIRHAMLWFGGKFNLAINSNGTAEFWENIGTDAASDWKLRETFSYIEGGLDIMRPFRVTVIPWGISNIGINFMQQESTSMQGSSRARSGSGAGSTFQVDLRRYGFEPALDTTLNQVIKTPAAQAWLAIRKEKANDAQALLRVRYPTARSFAIVPEQLGAAKPQGDPVFTWKGYADFDGTNPSQPQIAFSFVKETNAAWVKETDTQLVAKVTLESSDDRVYSPELWYYEAKIPTEVYVPEWTPVDMSPKWTYLRIQRKVASEACQFQAKFERNDEYDTLYQRGGPIQVRAKLADESQDVVIFEGAPIDRKPTVSGANAKLIGDEIDALDDWDRLNSTPITVAVSIEGKSVGDLLQELINQAGYFDSEIKIDADIYDLEVEGFSEPNSLRIFAVDAMIGDAIRELTGKYGFQGHSDIRVRRIPDVDSEEDIKPLVWKVYLDTPYMIWDDGEGAFVPDPAQLPTKLFYLDSSLIPTYTANEGLPEEEVLARTDVMRWNPSGDYGDNQHFIITSNFELTINRPDFNQLIASSSTGTGDGADGLISYVPPHPDVLDNPASAIFEGRLRTESIGLPELHAQTQAELDRQARKYYDRAQQGLIIASFDAEWQPDGDADEFIAILGRDQSGSPVSYGAFRVLSIDAEMREDHGHRRWEWGGNYVCEYVGPAAYDGIPMFSEVLP